MLTLGCAVAVAGQIVAAAHFARRMPLARLLALELGVGAALSVPFAALLESPRVELTPAFLGLLPFLSAGGLWSFYGQLRAQRVLTPTVAALVFCLGPVFASVASYLVFGEVLAPLQVLGAGLILAAVCVVALEPAGGPVR